MGIFRTRVWERILLQCIACPLLAGVALACACAAPVLGAAENIGSRLELFVDNKMIDKMTNVRLVMHSPTPREVVFTPDAAWEGGGSAYFTILRDGEKYRLYYRGCGPQESDWEHTCVAESADGVTFTRPDLGLFTFKGSKNNNIIYKGRGNNFWESHNFTPFVDPNPQCKPEERYKAVAFVPYWQGTGSVKRGLAGFASADGIHWKQIGYEPIFTDGVFDSQNVAFWDRSRQKYFLYYRPNAPIRSIARAVSDDFVHWSDPKLIDLGNTPPEHFYTNAVTPYCRDSYWHIGMPMRFVYLPKDSRVGFNEDKTDRLSDAVLITSRDGVRFDRTFMEAFIRPGLNSSNWGCPHSNQTPACGILQTSPEELSVYWEENWGSAPRIRRGTLRTDGFASVNAPYAGGEFTTKPIIFSGQNLIINYSTSAVGSVSVEIQDEAGRPIKGSSLGDFSSIRGDEIEHVMSWGDKNDVSSLAGRPVRLRFVMKDADLYSYKFR